MAAPPRGAPTPVGWSVRARWTARLGTGVTEQLLEQPAEAPAPADRTGEHVDRRADLVVRVVEVAQLRLGTHAVACDVRRCPSAERPSVGGLIRRGRIVPKTVGASSMWSRPLASASDAAGESVRLATLPIDNTSHRVGATALRAPAGRGGPQRRGSGEPTSDGGRGRRSSCWSRLPAPSSAACTATLANAGRPGSAPGSTKIDEPSVHAASCGVSGSHLDRAPGDGGCEKPIAPLVRCALSAARLRSQCPALPPQGRTNAVSALVVRATTSAWCIRYTLAR